jgi:hypothetical protein
MIPNPTPHALHILPLRGFPELLESYALGAQPLACLAIVLKLLDAVEMGSRKPAAA